MLSSFSRIKCHKHTKRQIPKSYNYMKGSNRKNSLPTNFGRGLLFNEQPFYKYIYNIKKVSFPLFLRMCECTLMTASAGKSTGTDEKKNNKSHNNKDI